MKLIALVCFLSVLVGCISLKTHRLTSQEVSESKSVDSPLQLDGWRLLLGTEGIIGDPVEAYTHLYAERDGCFLRIDGPADFKRLLGIRIKTPDEALALVRIFTDMETYLYFQRPHAVEFPQGNAIVHSAQNGFVVTRNLLYLKRAHRGFEVHQVQEFVSPNGTYSCRRGSLAAVLPRLPKDILFFQ